MAKSLTGEQLKSLLEMALAAQFCNLKNYTIKASAEGVDVYPLAGRDTINSVNGIFTFVDAFNLSCYITIENTPCCRPVIHIY